MPKTIEETDVLIARVAGELAEAYDSRATILVTCRLAFEGLDGVEPGKPSAERRQALAEATTFALAERLYPDDKRAQREAATIPANRPGGASVSPTAIGQRADAFSDVLAAGLTPDIVSVTAAFRLASIGGNKSYRQRVQETVAKKGPEAFVDATNKAATELTNANKGKREARNPGGSTVDVDGLTVDVIVTALRWARENVASMSDTDRAALAAALTETTAALV